MSRPMYNGTRDDFQNSINNAYEKLFALNYNFVLGAPTMRGGRLEIIPTPFPLSLLSINHEALYIGN